MIVLAAGAVVISDYLAVFWSGLDDGGVEIFIAAVALDGDIAYEQINPGNSKSGPLLFDVPVGADIAQVELHGDYTGDGVRVTVA